MENQHRQIKGYRELDEDEIALVNRIKMHGAETSALIEEIRAGLPAHPSEPQRWASIAQTHIQQGLMALTRAVTKPDFF